MSLPSEEAWSRQSGINEYDPGDIVKSPAIKWSDSSDEGLEKIQSIEVSEKSIDAIGKPCGVGAISIPRPTVLTTETLPRATACSFIA
jgi:hypothetical protein